MLGEGTFTLLLLWLTIRADVLILGELTYLHTFNKDKVLSTIVVSVRLLQILGKLQTAAKCGIHLYVPPRARWRHNLTSPECSQSPGSRDVMWWQSAGGHRTQDTPASVTPAASALTGDSLSDVIMISVWWEKCCMQGGVRPPSDPHNIDCKSSRCHQWATIRRLVFPTDINMWYNVSIVTSMPPCVISNLGCSIQNLCEHDGWRGRPAPSQLYPRKLGPASDREVNKHFTKILQHSKRAPTWSFYLNKVPTSN